MEVIEPDPASQQFPCPNQRVIYECRVLEAFSITWVLPISTLSVAGSLPIGFTRNDGQFTVALNGSEIVGVKGAFNINSTILIKPPLGHFNNTVLTCRVGLLTAVNPSIMSTITLSGELRHNHVYTFCDCLCCRMRCFEFIAQLSQGTVVPCI